MPPQTRKARLMESRSLRSKKVCFMDNFQISLTRCDEVNKLSHSYKLKKNVIKKNIKFNENSVKSSTNIKSKGKHKQHILPNKRKSTKHEENPPKTKKGEIFDDDSQKSNAKTITPIVVPEEKQSPKKLGSGNTHKPFIKHPTSGNISKSEISIKKSCKKKTTKESKLKKQMKLGRIFIKPTFPIKSILKKQIHSGDNERKQGQFVTTDSKTELNNNKIDSLVQPKILLCKIDQQVNRPVREVRKTNRHL